MQEIQDRVSPITCGCSKHVSIIVTHTHTDMECLYVAQIFLQLNIHLTSSRPTKTTTPKPMKLEVLYTSYMFLAGGFTIATLWLASERLGMRKLQYLAVGPS